MSDRAVCTTAEATPSWQAGLFSKYPKTDESI